MLTWFFKKQKEKQKKIETIEVMISALHVQPEQKTLYLQALSALDTQWLEKLFNNLIKFIETIEIKEMEDIKKQSFSTISWMRKKEAEEKTKEINALSFLFHNI